MKKLIFIFFSVLISGSIRSQSDNCSGAPALTIGACVTGAPGATQNIVGCGGANANDDVWYKFVATSASHSITVKGSATYDAVVQLYSGACSSLSSIGGCADSYANGGTESIIASGLTTGSTYYIRIYDYSSSASPGSFTTCVTLPPAAPGNNECTGAKALTVNASCVNTSTTSFAATQSTNVATSCNGTPDDDVWFSFVANNYTQTIKVTPTGSLLMDPVVELYSGTCGSMTSLACEDSTYSGEMEDMTATGLVPGNTYYIRVFDYYSDGGYPFDICVSGSPIVVGTQPNDDPCTAIHLPNVTADCNYLNFSTVGATSTSTLLAPAPTNCTNWQGSATTGTASPYYGTPTTGGYNTTTTKDVWFTITVPASGSIYIMPRPNMGAGWIQDGVMALYRGASCSALTQYTCTDDHDYPAGYNDFQPFLEASGLTPGETVYLRFFGYGSSSGNFGLCVTAPTNDLCSNALYMCDLNGYTASTSEAYKVDHPCNMLGNGELVISGPPISYSYSPGANPGAPFGLGGSWGTGSPFQDVYIDKNSWVRFTASSPTVSLKVSVYDCWGSGPNTATTSPTSPRGIQMQIFSTTSACCGFTPVSDYKENAAGSFTVPTNTSTFTINANSLTVGNDYYLMIDGWNGDICSYNIQALAGVALPDIVANPPTVCPGQTSLLTAPAGATSYTWEPGGANTQTLLVTPGTTETYTCYVGGVCGNKQALTKTITMKTVPSVSITASNSVICNGNTITLTGGGASTYSWSTGSTAGSFTAAPTGSQTYSVIGTAANGCTSTAVSNVTVNTLPTIVPGAVGSNTICNGSSANLTVSGANTYTWSPVATLSPSTGTAVTATPTTGTNYTVIGTAANGCTNSATYSVTVNPKPTISSTTTGSVVCNGNTTIISGTGGVTYTWSPTITDGSPFTPTATTVYTVIGTAANGCTNTATRSITVTPLPTLTVNVSNAVICNGNSTSLTASGASTYTWSNGIANGASFSPSVTASYTVTATSAAGCTNTAVRTVTVNALPTVSSTVTNSVICNGQSTTLTGTGTASTYTWTGSVTNGVAFFPSLTNSYTVTGTDGNGCSNTSVRSVTVNPLPTVLSTTTGSVICNGGSTTLNGTGASTYTWSSGVSDGVAFTPTATATYTVTGTNATTGCTNTAVRTITVSPTPTVATSTSNSVICIGNSTSLTGSGATTYTWSNGVANGASFSPTVTATYTVIGATGSCTNTAVRTITVNPLPGVSSTASNSTICNGGSTTLNGTGASTYTWTGGISNGVAFSPTTTTTYTVTGTDANGCVNTSVRTVTVNAVPTSTTSTSGTITCVTNTVNLNSNLAGASYTWTPPGGSSISGGTANNQNAVGQGAGIYTLNIMSPAGCTYSTTLATNINTITPTASAGNGTLTCAVTSTVLTGGPASGVTYSWSGPGIIGSNTIASITASVAGTYTLVTTSTVNGCSSAAAVGTLTNNLTTPTVTAGSNQTITCAAPTVTLSGSATAGSNYSWSNGAPTSTTTVSGSGTYTLTASNPSTGCSATSTVQVLPSAGTPTGNISAASNSITCANTSATVSITSGSSPISITWTGPGITGPANTASTTVSQGNVTYTVTLTNTSSMCSQSYNVFVPLNTTPVVASASISAGSSSITCSTTSLTLSSSPTGPNYTYSWTGPGIVSGGNTANPVVNLGGNYSVTITNTVNGCSGVTGTTNVAVPSNTATPTLSLSATSVTTTCGNPSATVTASSNSNPNTTYTWTAPATGTISNTSVSNPGIGGSGVFTVAITNTVSGCPSAPMTVTVTADANIPTFTLSANAVIANCTTPAPGITINTSPSGVTYSWSPAPNSGGNTASPTFTAAGNYTCLVTNPGNSCSTNVPVVAVTVDKTVPTATATPASSITCSSTLIAISSTVTPTTNVSYNWTGPNVVSGNTTLSPNIGSGGSYVIALTNTVNGCTNNYTVNVPTNTTTPTVSLTANSLTTTCANPTATFNASSSAASATYSWTSPAGGSLTSNTTNTPTASGSGVFTVSVTDPVNGCVSASMTATLTADANIPTFSLPANTATITCAVSNPSVALTSTVSGVTYSWSPAPSSGATVASPTFTAPGSYTCLITNPTNSCSTSGAVVTVTQDLVVPTATASASSSITCSTNSLSITSAVTPTNNVSYNWTGPNVLSGSSTLSPVIGTGGNYVIAMTNTVNGCSNSYTVNVPTNTLTPAISVAANAYTTTCSVPGVTLSATSSSDPATTYSWTAPSTGTISNTTISNPVVGGSGVFTVAVTNTVNGCVSAIETVTLTPDLNIPTFSLQATTATINCSVPSPSVSLTSTVTGVTYSWNPVPASGVTTASPTFTAPGNYTCTITNPANNCSTSAAQISVNTDTALPVVTITPNASVTCNSSTVTLTSTVTPASATYTWSGTGITGGLNGNAVTASAGSYSLTVTDPANGCSVTATAAVGTNTTAPTLTVASTGTVITCSTTSNTLTAESLSGTPTWISPGGSSATNPVTATVPGDYVATVTDINNGCTTSQTISISNNTVPPNADAGVATVIPCGSSSVTLMGSSTSTDVVTYSWAGPTAGSISGASNIANPTVTSAGVYTLTVTNSITGCSQTATVNVTQNNVTANFTADPRTGEAPLAVSFTNTSVGATSYSWSFGNGGTSTSQDPNTVFNDAGTYYVILTASNGPCSDTAVRTIVVEDGFSIEIPNVFTPNGDGANELFHIKTSGVKSAEGYIYNRWGQILYSWDVLNISWDGKASNGENCPDGTYYYLIKVIDKKDKEHLAPGFVLIAR
jgi:gliding motility-associated-like protein